MNSKFKRIIAWICIGILGLLYLATLVLALLGVSIYSGLFLVCLLGTLVLPLLAFIVIYLYDRYNGKRAPGDPAPNDSDN